MKKLYLTGIIILTCLTTQVFAHGDNTPEHSAKRSESDLARDITSKPESIIEFAGVSKGDQVLDFLAGGGYYSELLSNTVGTTGRVVLHNNKAYLPYIGKELEARLKGNRLANVEKLVSEASALQFGENQFDVAFLVLGYHDFFYQDKGWNVNADVVMPQLFKSLKKGGKFLVIDHSALPDTGIQDSKKLHRIDEKFVLQDLTQRGFKLLKSSQLLRNTNDPRNITAFAPEIRRNTDRFVYLFVKE